MMQIVIIPIGTQGMGKSTVARQLDVILLSTHGHASQESYFLKICEISASSDRPIFIDRCNIKESNRMDVLLSLSREHSYHVIYVDFIADNSTEELKKKAFQQSRDRDQTEQSIKYNPKNKGLALRRVINMKMELYESPIYDGICSNATSMEELVPHVRQIDVLLVDISSSVDDIVQAVKSLMKPSLSSRVS